MTPYVSLALFRRNGAVVFKPPRKERPDDVTQARKAAMRFWSGNLSTGDTLVKVILMRESGGRLQISERAANGGADKPWIQFEKDASAGLLEPHLAACLSELGVDPSQSPPPLPDTLEINGAIYRREI